MTPCLTFKRKTVCLLNGFDVSLIDFSVNIRSCLGFDFQRAIICLEGKVFTYGLITFINVL